MAAGSIKVTLAVDSVLLSIQLGQLAALLEKLPKRRARRFSRKVYRLVSGTEFCQFRDKKTPIASTASHIALQIRIVGIDELIAAAMRAGK